MNIQRKLSALIVIIMISLLALSGNALAASAAVGESSAAVEYSDRDLSGDWEQNEAVSIALADSGSNCGGSGVSIDGSNITIAAAGTYVLTGTLSDGSIIVNAAKDDKVQLVLSGADVTCSTGPAINIVQGDKVFITLADGTTSSIADGATYTLTEDEPYAAIFSKDDLTINGGGTLNVTGNYMHGISSKDDLVIANCALNVVAAEDGLRGKDMVAINGATISIEAGTDGIKSNNAEEAERGIVSIDGGTITIVAGTDGIQADNIAQINAGTLMITTGGGSANASTQQYGDWGQWGSGSGRGNRGGFSMSGDAASTRTDTTITDAAAAQSSTPTAEASATVSTTAAESATESTSAKGIKAASAIYINGGTLTIDSSDDSIHSNGSACISGGTLTLASGDDGIHADSALAITAGDITITKSYEGIEGLTIDMSGGTVRLTTSDDGLNAAGGNDASSLGGRMGQNAFAASSDAWIKISGGYLCVDASGDGIDSNGALYISGGATLVSGPTGSGNGALDYNGTAEISGGILLAAGAVGMAQNMGSSSTQPSLLIQTGSMDAGTPVTLSDADGNVIVSYSPAKQYGCVVVSTPELAIGNTYKITTGGALSGETTDGFAQGGEVSGQTELATFELTSATVNVSASGVSEGGDPSGIGGGRGNHGGMTDAMPADRVIPGNGGTAESGELTGGIDGSSSATVRTDDAAPGGDVPTTGELPGGGNNDGADNALDSSRAAADPESDSAVTL